MRIDWLIIKRNLEGNASVNEKEEYRKWSSQESSTKRYEKELRENYTRQDKYDTITDDEVTQGFQLFEKRTRRSRHLMLYRRTIAAAACVAIVFGINSTLKETAVFSEVPEGVPPIVHKVRLTTASNIMSIDLSNDNERLIAENIEVGEGAIKYENKKNAAGEIEIHTLTTPEGKTWNVVLADGTSVWLNANSELRFPTAFTEGKPRVVSLKGEGYFEVKHSDKSPFIVHSGGADVRVYGTKFNINSYHEGIVKTVLIEGMVSVKASNTDSEIRIVPDQMAIFYCNDNKITLNDVNALDYIAWKEGIFLFNEVPLSEILEQVAAWYGYKLEYRNSTSMEKKMYCKIPRMEGIKEVLNVLVNTGCIDYEITDKTVTIN